MPTRPQRWLRTATVRTTARSPLRLTVTNIDTGRYSVTGTIPTTYSGGDTVIIVAVAVIGGLTFKFPLTRDVLDRLVVPRNQALTGFPFYAVQAANPLQPATGQTFTATRQIDGGAFGNCANAPTEVGNGWYKINLAATDLNGATIALNFAAQRADGAGDNPNIMICYPLSVTARNYSRQIGWYTTFRYTPSGHTPVAFPYRSMCGAFVPGGPRAVLAGPFDASSPPIVPLVLYIDPSACSSSSPTNTDADFAAIDPRAAQRVS